MPDTLTIERRGGVAAITLNRPDRLNAISLPMCDDLLAATADPAGDPAVRCVLITGAGRGFCAGADLADSNMDDAGDLGGRIRADMDRGFNAVVRALDALPKPLVAAVNGAAAGGGMSLALAADICIAGRSAFFAQVFGPQLGLVPDMGSTWYLPRAIGRARALACALTGERISAERAVEWGMIWACVDDADLAAEAWALAERLAAGPTIGLAATRRAFAAADGNDLDRQLDVERDMQGDCAGTADFREGVAAFRAKRKPVFRGR